MRTTSGARLETAGREGPGGLYWWAAARLTNFVCRVGRGGGKGAGCAVKLGIL